MIVLAGTRLSLGLKLFMNTCGFLLQDKMSHPSFLLR